LPNDPDVIRAIGAIQRRLGDWEKSTRSYRSAMSRNPKDPVLIRNLALNYIATRDYENAAKTFDRAVALAPQDFEIKSLRAWVDVYWKGDFARFNKLLTESPEGPDTSPVAALARFNVQFFQRKFDDALASLARTPFENMRGDTSAPLPKSFLAAQVYRAKGDAEQARLAFEQALPVAEQALAASPGDAARHSLLGLIYAGLGRNQQAVAAGRRAAEILPESKDAFNGPILIISLSRIFTMVGGHEEAISLLQKSLRTPNGITVHELRLDPIWDPLREDPIFQQMVAEGAGKKR
jgi:serine/threonine-protein kinase